MPPLTIFCIHTYVGTDVAILETMVLDKPEVKMDFVKSVGKGKIYFNWTVTDWNLPVTDYYLSVSFDYLEWQLYLCTYSSEIIILMYKEFHGKGHFLKMLYVFIFLFSQYQKGGAQAWVYFIDQKISKGIWF